MNYSIQYFMLFQISIISRCQLACSIADCKSNGCIRVGGLSCILGCAHGFQYQQNVLGTPIICVACGAITACTNCNLGYYYEQGNMGKTPGCFLCPQGCSSCGNPYSCSDGSCPTGCTTCDDSGCTVCTSGSPVNGVCPQATIPCDPNCTITSCNTTTGVCSACDSGYYLSLNTCSLCQDGCATCMMSSANCQICTGLYTYYNNSCFLCTSPCLTCSTSSTSCLSCITTEYTLDASTHVCCQSPCLTCSQINCNTCINEQYYIYFYDNIASCAPCQTPCLTCTLASTQCLSCVDTSLTLISNTCVCLSNQYYATPTSCSNCTSPCATCVTSDNYCITCIDQYYVSLNYCYSCQQPCFTCLDINNCTSCTDTTYMTLNQFGQCNCPSNMYNSNGNCLSCQLPCSSCFPSATYCTACNGSNFSILLGVCSCNPGFLYNSITFMCEQCNLDCATCITTIDLCTECSFQHTILNGDGTCTCAHGYGLITPQNCQICQSPCLTCINTITQCLSCISGYYSHDGCYKCPEGCQICLDQHTCESCIQPYYYLKNQTCQLCSQPCLTCLSQFDTNNNILCTSCLNTLTLIGYKCQCQDGLYLENNLCKKCDPSCSQCSSNQCLQCKDQNLMIIQNSKCICSDGYYINDGLCSKCASQCISCEINYNNCTQCVNKLMTFVNGSCKCIAGYYQISDTNICSICDSSCGTCEQQSNICTSCSFVNSMIVSGQCLCQDGYFLIASTQQCVNCEGQCSICPNRDECTMCNHGYYLLNKKCFLCPLGCSICMQTQSNLSCLRCDQGYELFNYLCQLQAQNLQVSTLNNSCTSVLNQYNQNTIYIQANQINIQIRHLDIYLNNDLAANISYLQQGYASKISEVTIDNLNSSQFTYSVNSNNGILFQIHLITFNFTKTITKVDQVHVHIQFYSSIKDNDIISSQCFILTPTYQSNQTNPNVQAAYQGVQISLVISAFLAALLGGFEFILSICDIITWLSTFYYLNVTYPNNVNYIFQKINLQQFIYLPSFNLPLNQQGDPYYFYSPFKFMQKSVDPLFINNIINDCALLITPIILYVISKMYFIFERKFSMTSYVMNRQKNQSYCLRIMQELRSKALYFIIYFRAIMLKYIHLNMLDLVMAASLQLMTYPPNQYSIVFANTLFALLAILLISYQCVQIYQSTKYNKQIHKTKLFQETYEPLYINLKNVKFDQRFYACVILYSKILYIIILISCYNHPILQTVGCASLYFLLIAYLFYVNPYSSLSKFCLEVIPNFCVLQIILITTFLAVNEEINLIQDIENIGWAIIAFISISMMTQFYFLLEELFKQMIQRLKNKL